MTIEETLFTTLSADGDVGPLVSNADSPETFRIYSDPTTENISKPYIVYTLIFGEHFATFSGRTTLKRARIQIDCYATTRSGVRALADHIYDAVDGGMALASMNEISGFEDQTRLRRITLDIVVWE